MATIGVREVAMCPTCGSADVVVDAWAAWSVEKQDWELQSTFDAAYCNACDGEIRYVEFKPVKEEAP